MALTSTDDDIRPLLDNQEYAESCNNVMSTNDDAVVECLTKETCCNVDCNCTKCRTCYGRGHLSSLLRTKPSQTFINIVMTIMSVTLSVLSAFTLPLCALSMVKSGSDISCMLIFSMFWSGLLLHILAIIYKLNVDKSISLSPRGNLRSLIIIGFLNAVGGVLQLYATTPEKTPPYIQSLLGNIGIPLTIVMRFLILRKGAKFTRGLLSSLFRILFILITWCALHMCQL